MPLGRIFDDVATRAIEFNLGFVSRVSVNKDTLSQQLEETQPSQMIELKPLNTTLPTIQRKITARPLFRGISDSITRGDIVLFARIAKKFYYIGPLNTFNDPNETYSNFYNSKLESRGLYLKSEIEQSTGRGSEYAKKTVKKLQKRKNKLDLYSDFGYGPSKHSDVLLEGRHSNAIRIGSRTKYPLLNISNNNNSIEESLSRGSLISLLSNGSLEENFTLNSGFLLSADILTENDNPLFKLNLGNDNTEEVFDYNYGEVQSTTTFDQIIITSDKITFDARGDLGDFTVSSNRNINFGAKKNFTLNNQGNSVINSGNIYLGVPAKSKKEPLVLGDELRTLLLDIMAILQDSRALVQGVPIPLYDQTSQPMFQRIQSLIDKLQPREQDDNGIYQDGNTPFLSKHHFIEINNREQNNEG